MEIKITLEDGKKVNAHVGDQLIKTDQSPKSGGEGSAPEPFALFLASIGTCAGIYVKFFCDQRGIPTDNIYLTQKLDFNPTSHLYEKIVLDINLPATFPEKYLEAVKKAADQCAVKRHLLNPPKIEVNTVVIK